MRLIVPGTGNAPWTLRELQENKMITQVRAILQKAWLGFWH